MLPVTVAVSLQLLPTVVLVGDTSVVAMVGLVFCGRQPFGRCSAASVVVSVPVALERIASTSRSTPP